MLATAGLDTLAVRVPAHPMAQAILQELDFPLAAPSANPSESISPTTSGHVRESFPDLHILEGGPCMVGLESTIVDLTADIPVILRPGSVTKHDIESTLGLKLGKNLESKIKAPGQMKRHYAPSLPVRLNTIKINEGEALLSFGDHTLFGATQEINLSPKGNLQEAAANLFAALAQLDSPRYKAIAVMPIPNEGIGTAINDRLTRAASPKS